MPPLYLKQGLVGNQMDHFGGSGCFAGSVYSGIRMCSIRC